jgi:branched-subunit amino acid aminotransferase/4-amino-4-deoxychorismate lyase
MANQYCIYNSKLYPSNALLISPDNRAFRYGDGFFETMKMISGKIILEALHMERLCHSLQIMQFDKPDYFTPAYIHQQIQDLVNANNHQQLARVRLMVFRGNGGLYDVDDNQPNYLIQSWELKGRPAYNSEGAIVDIYQEARKAADVFSAIKSNSYLPYVMAAIWCKRKGLDDALIMNCYDRIAEATTFNVFIVKEGIVQTPPLSEGCINGVVRRYLLQYMNERNIRYEEKALTPEEVLNADELFLTNAGYYIRWVQQCGEKMYGNAFSRRLYDDAIVPLIT